MFHHGGWWPVVGWAHEGDAWVAPPRREAQATEVVGNELKAPKANGFTEGEATTHQTFVVNGDGERGWGNNRNIQMKSTLQIPLPDMPTIDVFYIGKI
jgi:hypothetical protein